MDKDSTFDALIKKYTTEFSYIKQIKFMSTINYSITITHYNSPALLSRMLLSIPERDDIQVIVVDDASTEENKEKISKLSHRNMELVFI